jgi:hypothetical protein
MPLTPDAKKLLAETIRGAAQDPETGIRARLLRAIHDEADRRYRLSLPIGHAGLDEVHRRRRERIEAWIDERARAGKPKNKGELAELRERLLGQAEKEAAATLVNRLVLLRHLEAHGVSKPAVITGGWISKGYREFREFAPGLTTDETEGYAILLQLVFDELANAMPGLFGNVGLSRLLPIPASTLREVVDLLDDPALISAWTDDTTLGWVYQYWNDPERREVDARLDAQSKLARGDIAAKTQVFTERYMVEWLLQNSLGFTWLAMCQKRGWPADAERVLPVLDARRANWRKKREAGEVALDALMPVEGELEEHWKYFVPQHIPEDAVAKAPESVRAIKILDPACGSGHFLVIAFDLLAALYREEARHLGKAVTEKEIAESILENNLHGIDIDPRAIQIAAAGLYLKAKALSREAQPRRVNLVAPALQLGNLPPDDPAVTHLRQDLKREVGIPEELTNTLLSSLAGVDYLGSLLKIDVAVENTIKNVELEFERSHGQGDLFGGFPAKQVKLSVGEAKATILYRLERFLAAHSSSDDLGLQLDGEQLATGLRFLTLARPGTYDIVVGNPPYFGTQSLADTDYIDNAYPLSKENLCTAILERAMDLARQSGQVAFVAVRNWLYVSQLSAFRGNVFRTFPPSCAADLGLGGFESLPGVEVVMVIARRGTAECYVADVRTGEPIEKASALGCADGGYRTEPEQLARLPGSPFVYRWSRASIDDYLSRPLLGEVAPVRVGMKTSDNLRFLRCPWELAAADVRRSIQGGELGNWVPYVKGAAGKVWIEPLADLINWRDGGLEVRLALDAAYGQGPQGEKHFFKRGVAFSTIGRSFIARAHRYPSICDVAGSSAFPPDVAATVCLLNSRFAREVVQDLNPTINFQVGDVARIPYRLDRRAGDVFKAVEAAFVQHEATDELSAGFRQPSPSPWQHAQTWAQSVVDSAEADGMPGYEPTLEPPSPFAFVSFAVGVALGRFGANGEGWTDESSESTLSSGVLFLTASGAHDSLNDDACSLLNATWRDHGAVVGEGDDLRTYLRKSFFEAHKKLYENRPIYFPLSSAKKSFVAFVSIHRWADDTLNVLLADYLLPARRNLEGELEDIKSARSLAGGRGNRTERRFTDVQKLLEELSDFIARVTEVAEKGPPQSDGDTVKRQADARYSMDLSDGVMVNSAALWSLLEPQWKEPKRWWGQLANRSGPKGTHFDWSRTAARYFQMRVQEECKRDPVLAAAHHCLWRHHPKVAYEWELRLQHDLSSGFAITEPNAETCRALFLHEESRVASEIHAAEVKRRERRSRARAANAEPGGADA